MSFCFPLNSGLRRSFARTVKTAGILGLFLVPQVQGSAATSPPLKSPAGKPVARLASPRQAKPAMDCWYGIFVDSQHLGYMHLEAKPILIANQKRWENRVDFFVNPTPSDATTAERRIARSLTRQDGTLLEEWETLTSDGDTRMTHWTYQGKKVLVEKNEPGKSPTRKFVVNNDGKPLHDSFFFPTEFTGSGPRKALPAGWKLSKEEIITVDYQPISAIRVTMAGRQDGSKGSFWIDRDRQLVRADIHLSDSELRLERMAAKSAVQLVTPLPPQDTIIPPTFSDTARDRRKRNYVVSNLVVPPTAATDDVQSIVSLKQPDGRYTAVIQVTAAPVEEKGSPSLSAIDRTKFAPYLAAGPLTPANDPAMRTLARQIVGSETNTARAAKRLDEWIHTNLSYDFGFSGVRSAQQTLTDRRGVCQNYATLFVTLARAAGIPAKYCSGPVYSSDGKFYRHAWAECWTGKWVAFDPTWGQPFADAFHIKLAEGEPEVLLNSWNSSSPPTIQVLAPNADIAQVIREHTPMPVAQTAQPVAQTPAASDEADALLAKLIQQNATPLPGESVMLVPRLVYAPTVLMRLPWGSTTQVAHATTVHGAPPNEEIIGTRYTLPDGRACLVTTSNRQTPMNPELELAFGFEYKQKDGTWTRAFIPCLKFNGDKATLAKTMANQTAAKNLIPYADPPSPDTLLPLLPPGTTAAPLDNSDYRDGSGKPLVGISYHLPDGKICVIVQTRIP